MKNFRNAGWEYYYDKVQAIILNVGQHAFSCHSTSVPLNSDNNGLLNNRIRAR
jgi:hypothetical protein